MEENDMLSALLKDPKALEQAISAASALIGSPPPAADPAPITATDPVPITDSSTTSYDPSADLMRRAMPVLSRIAQNGQTAVDPKKRALLNAVKPFVHANIGAQIDHGMRLVSLARMATAILNKPQEDSEHV